MPRAQAGISCEACGAMSVRLLVWALAIQLLLAAAFTYFAVTGFPFLPDEPATERPADCGKGARAGRSASGASTSRTPCR
jgi:hypothetical protein